MKSGLAGGHGLAAVARGARTLARPSSLARPEFLAVATAVAGLALRLRQAWDDIPSLLLRTTSDDAFYYFQIARNIAGGRNVTFDGETLTNGFHPLWMAAVTPIYFFTDDRDLAVHAAFTLASVLGAATALVVFAAVRTLTGNGWAAVAAAAFYALHPRIVAESGNGMETALAVFMVAVTMWLFFRIARGDRPASMRDYAVLGAAAGLMVLARTDTAFIVPPLLAALVVGERGGHRRATTLVTGAVALAVVAPWAVWSLVSFGTVVQVSGVAVAELDRRAFLDAHGSSFGTQVQQSWDVTNDTFFDRLPHQYFVPAGTAALPLMLAAAALLAVALLAPLTPHRRETARQVLLLAVPTSGIALALLFSSAIRWHVREWYLAPMAVAGAVFLGIMVSYGHGALSAAAAAWSARVREVGAGSRRAVVPWARLLVLAPYGLVVLGFATWYGPQWSGRWTLELPHKLNMLEAARWLSNNTEPDARVGSFNAGIIGYFSERTVVNLDGVVNEEAYEARRDRRLREYVRDEDIRYLVDLRSALTFARVEGEACPEFEVLATIGRPLYYLGGGQLDVMKRVDGPGTGGAPCAAGTMRSP